MDESCNVDPINKTTPSELLDYADIALLAVNGMGCQNCATRVRNSLLSLDGVYNVDVFLNMGMAEVTYDGQQVSAHMLVDAISQAGKDGRHHYLASLVAIS